jgi:hypothetical protein
MRLVLVPGLAVLALAIAPGRLVAQAAASQTITTQQTMIAAAQLRLSAVRPSRLERPSGALMTQRAQGNRRQGSILMIVGAAGIVTGLIADENLITIAGAGVGGFGLYQYLQATH